MSSPARLLPLLCAALLGACVGCSAPHGAKVTRKEVFLEPYRLAEVPVTRWPLTPQDEDRCYSALRSLKAGRNEGLRKLATLLDQPLPPAAGGVAALESEVVIDEEAFPGGVPETLYQPTRFDARADSGVYVGHTVFRATGWIGKGPPTHHLRFMVVNRESSPLVLRADRIGLSLPAGQGQESVLASQFTFLAAANERGEAIRTLTVAPGQEGLLHVFFQAEVEARALHLRFVLEEVEFAPVGTGAGLQPADPAGGADPRGELPAEPGPAEDGREARAEGPPPEEQELRSWSFFAVLVRRYVIEEGLVSPLERAAALGEPLPEPASGDYVEPRVTPLAPR